MKNGRPEHYWRIHAKVAKRVWADISRRTKDVIANDAAHTSEDFKWFEKKVATDTERLFTDPDYFDNQLLTFKFEK